MQTTYHAVHSHVMCAGMSFINVHRPTTDAGGQLQIKNLALLNIYTDDRSRPTLAVGVSENTILRHGVHFVQSVRGGQHSVATPVVVQGVFNEEIEEAVFLATAISDAMVVPRLSSLAVFPGHSWLWIWLKPIQLSVLSNQLSIMKKIPLCIPVIV